MSDLAIGVMFGIGVGGWIYSQSYRRTGGNKPQSYISAIIVGVIALLAMVVLLSFAPN